MSIERAGNLLIPTVAYGDAAGLPFETWSAQKIAEDYRRITRLHPPTNNPYYTGTHPPGTTSDDTQLTRVVAEALIEADGFDLAVVAKKHVAEYDRTPKIRNKTGKFTARGWGGSTVTSMERLKQGVGPRASGAPDGSGNGVIMKMAPLTFWQAARKTAETQRLIQYDQLTELTHATKIAKVCTRVHGSILTTLLTKAITAEDLPEYALQSASWHEEQLGEDGRELSKALGYLATTNQIDAQAILANTDANGFYVPQTLAMAYGAFMASQPDLEQTVFGAVNLGGDTDSIASIAATMSLFANPEEASLPEDTPRITEIEKLSKLSQQLTKAALRKE